MENRVDLMTCNVEIAMRDLGKISTKLDLQRLYVIIMAGNVII